MSFKTGFIRGMMYRTRGPVAIPIGLIILVVVLLRTLVQGLELLLVKAYEHITGENV